MAKQKSRPKRWAEAVQKAQTALSEIEDNIAKYSEATSELKELQDEYENWKDNLPDNLQQSALAEKLQTIVDFSIEDSAQELESAHSTASDLIGECESADMPMGFGKD